MTDSPAPLDPNKYHVLNKKQQKQLIIVLSIFAFIVAPVLGFFYYRYAINRPSQTSDEVTYFLRSGTSLHQAANDLAIEGAINSAALFKVYMYTNGLQESLQAGVFVIPAGSTIIEVADLLQHGVYDRSITFIEGWRVEEFAREASEKLENIDYEEFLKIALEYEGKLYPDTYQVNTGITEVELLDMLLSNFESRTSGVLTEENLASVGLTEQQVIILASLIEREAFAEDEKPVIAGILINRFESGELLGVDATVQYIKPTYYLCDLNQTSDICPSEDQKDLVDWWPKELTANDLAIDSPYNTRLNVGLPPTPISNPSVTSIEAVINRVDTNFKYYLHDQNGKIHYSTTLEEHNQKVNTYL